MSLKSSFFSFSVLLLLAFNALGKTECIWADDQLLQETRNSQTTTYAFEPQTFKPLAQIIDNQIYHYHLDHLGTPKHLTNHQGDIVWQAQYKTYGQAALKSDNRITNHLRFQGQYFDEETGLHYNRHRYYNPNTGQFTQQDPIGLLGGVNNYQYAPNPISWVDPLGLSCKEGSPNSKPDFYVGPAGPVATLPGTGYRYMRHQNDDGSINRFAPLVIDSKSAPVTYFGFEKYDTAATARNAFQVKGPEVGPDATGDGSWSDAGLRGEFDTLQLYENGAVQARIPKWAGDTDDSKLEPFAKAYPEYGTGGAVQMHADSRKIDFDKVDILPEK